jgi:hypothetical protein
MRPDTKRCPECGEEFVHTAVTCSDCDVPLRLASELAGPAGDGLPPTPDLVLLRAEGPAWIDALAEALGAEGIPSRVQIIDPERHGIRSGVRGSACGIFVREADVAAARAVDARVHREQVPDLGAAEAHEASAGEGEGCPACGHELAPDASECPDCGLVFG